MTGSQCKKITKGVGSKEMEKVCVGHLGVKGSEKQCLLERAMRSLE